jgi:hypothetical protein
MMQELFGPNVRLKVLIFHWSSEFNAKLRLNALDELGRSITGLRVLK